MKINANKKKYFLNTISELITGERNYLGVRRKKLEKLENIEIQKVKIGSQDHLLLYTCL
jgi:hypothetical protein